MRRLSITPFTALVLVAALVSEPLAATVTPVPVVPVPQPSVFAREALTPAGVVPLYRRALRPILAFQLLKRLIDRILTPAVPAPATPGMMLSAETSPDLGHLIDEIGRARHSRDQGAITKAESDLSTFITETVPERENEHLFMQVLRDGIRAALATLNFGSNDNADVIAGALRRYLSGNSPAGSEGKSYVQTAIAHFLDAHGEVADAKVFATFLANKPLRGGPFFVRSRKQAHGADRALTELVTKMVHALTKGAAAEMERLRLAEWAARADQIVAGGSQAAIAEHKAWNRRVLEKGGWLGVMSKGGSAPKVKNVDAAVFKRLTGVPFPELQEVLDGQWEIEMPRGLPQFVLIKRYVGEGKGRRLQNFLVVGRKFDPRETPFFAQGNPKEWPAFFRDTIRPVLVKKSREDDAVWLGHDEDEPKSFLAAAEFFQSIIEARGVTLEDGYALFQKLHRRWDILDYTFAKALVALGVLPQDIADRFYEGDIETVAPAKSAPRKPATRPAERKAKKKTQAATKKRFAQTSAAVTAPAAPMTDREFFRLLEKMDQDEINVLFQGGSGVIALAMSVRGKAKSHADVDEMIRKRKVDSTPGIFAHFEKLAGYQRRDTEGQGVDKATPAGAVSRSVSNRLVEVNGLMRSRGRGSFSAVEFEKELTAGVPLSRLIEEDYVEERPGRTGEFVFSERGLLEVRRRFEEKRNEGFNEFRRRPADLRPGDIMPAGPKVEDQEQALLGISMRDLKQAVGRADGRVERIGPQGTAMAVLVTFHKEGKGQGFAIASTRPDGKPILVLSGTAQKSETLEALRRAFPGETVRKPMAKGDFAKLKGWVKQLMTFSKDPAFIKKHRLADGLTKALSWAGLFFTAGYVTWLTLSGQWMAAKDLDATLKPFTPETYRYFPARFA